MLRSAFALLIAGVVAAPALANDTSAELATGGLIFVRNENVEMRSEDLTISAKEVSVRYRFFNTSDKDVTVLVAFPLPEIKIEEPDQNIAVPTEDPVNFLAFTTTVNVSAAEPTFVNVNICAVLTPPAPESGSLSAELGPDGAAALGKLTDVGVAARLFWSAPTRSNTPVPPTCGGATLPSV